MNHDDLNADIRKLVALLKKIVRNHPQGSEQVAKLLDQKSFNINLCFLTFIPMTPEDLIEFEEMYDEFLSRYEESLEKRENPKREFKLNARDLDFLKQHGIRF